MKKNYIIPQTRFFVVQLQRMIADSLGAKGAELKGGAASSNYDVLSRQSNSGLWDDEDE